MPKKSSKSKKNVRMIACENLVTLNAISNSGTPLCNCRARKFTMSPFNIVCQICELYRERKDGKTHAKMYFADSAPDFNYDLNEIDISDDDFEDEILEIDDDEDFDDDIDDDEEEEEEEIVAPKRKKRASKKIVVAEEDEDEEEEEEEEEEFEDDEEVALVIGVTKEKDDEEELDYVDEREEGLGKKHGKFLEDEELDEEDEELEEELEELEEEMLGIEDEDIEDDDEDVEVDDDDTSATSSVDFEKDVIAKIKKIGSGEDVKEICPFCQKSKVSVLRHLPRCKRTPEDVKQAYQAYKSKK